MLFAKKLKNDYGVSLDEKNINKLIDYTNLSPIVSHKELERFICTAYKNKYFSVVVNPVDVEFCKQFIDYKFKSSIKVGTVISFPLGADTMESKVFQIKRAIKDGVDEIDAVITLSKIKMNDWSYLKIELGRLRRACRKKILKVVIETAVLTKQEIEKISILCARARVDYIMTCTGFADGGASPEVVDIIRAVIKNKCGIKASGGIETKAQAVNLIRIGANRIGTSREI